MSTYRLRFIDSLEKIGRVLELEAANDDDVTALSWVHAIRSDMTVEVWQDDRMVTRTTPMTARLFVDQPGRYSLLADRIASMRDDTWGSTFE